MWGRCGRLGEVYVCPALEPDAHTLVRVKGEWGHEDSRIFDGNVLEEDQDVVTIVCNGGQRLDSGRFGGGLIRLAWL